MNKIDMKSWGLTSSMEEEAKMYSSLNIGRIISQYNSLYEVVWEGGKALAEVSGKFSCNAKGKVDFPAVGDFVTLSNLETTGEQGIIHNLLSRKSSFSRKMAGTAVESQVVAANIDEVFICMSLNKDFNIRRLERYLAIGWDSGAIPLVVLTKSDLCNDIEEKLYEVEKISMGAEVIVTSAKENGYFNLLEKVKKGHTITFIGSSGVGKSTLINCLVGEDKMETKEIRKVEKGMHTTTRRQIIMLEKGAMVMDTPGMRELSMESIDIESTFADIDKIASSCKFKDCAHDKEPGCAVKKAIDEGILDPKRFESYKKLEKEVSYGGLSSREIENAKIKEMFGSKKGMKQFKNIKDK